MSTAAADHQEVNVLAAVADAALDPNAKERREKRRAKSRVRQLDHHAFYAKDVEATRKFYEDVLEMPMTLFLNIPDEVFTGDPLPYCHFFFEMGDGSALAFFDYPAFHDGKEFPAARSVYDHHVAMRVDSDDDVAYLKDRLEKAGVKVDYIDHGVFHSIYFQDPNGLLLEFCSLPAISEEFSLRAEKLAHRELKKWKDNRHTVPRTLAKG
jgi:catechol 2,3-dioxygenase-like lactoylglutathione lyase family enzyme